MSEHTSDLARLLEQCTRELQSAETRLRNLITRNADGIIIVDHEGVVRFVNPAAESLFNRRAAALLGSQFGFPLVAGETTEMDVLRGGGETAVAEMRVVETEWEGEPALLASLRDITERKRAEEERALLIREQAARRQAEEASRLKDEFFATVSHELRTPLNAMLGWAKLLRAGNLDEETVARAAETIERSAKSQAQIIEDLLDASRIVSGKLRLEVHPFDLATVIRATAEAMRPATEARQIGLRVTYDPRVGAILGDPDRIQQVVWNLLSNAIKFTPPGGQVEMRLELVGTDAQVSVSDTGMGISPEFLPYVFERFRQADGTSTRKYGGLGLGLAIVRHLTELHGGTVRAASDGAGRGATFTVRLPLAGGEAALAGVPSPGGRVPDQGPASLCGARVVVVDDEADTRDILVTMLTRCGAEVTACASAAEALEVLRECRPDVLISDIGMPGEDGYDLIRKVRALGPEHGGGIPALALTAYARGVDRARAISAGFQVHLAKPVDPSDLSAVVAGLVGRGGSGNKPD
ncbi:MAG TPA: ATP-binding protein [Blastocatellia bacterium]|nr:ATP-binding protein [Blastocatellia bacterium]